LTERDRWILEQAMRTLYRIQSAKTPTRKPLHDSEKKHKPKEKREAS
jgi:hypothetical protein